MRVEFSTFPQRRRRFPAGPQQILVSINYRIASGPQTLDFLHAARARQIRGRLTQSRALASNGNRTWSILIAPAVSANHRALDHFHARDLPPTLSGPGSCACSRAPRRTRLVSAARDRRIDSAEKPALSLAMVSRPTTIGVSNYRPYCVSICDNRTHG